MQQSDPQNLTEPGQDVSTPITTCAAKSGRSWWLPGQGSLPSPVLCTWMAAAEGQGGRGSIALVLPERSARLLTASCSPPVVLINQNKLIRQRFAGRGFGWKQRRMKAFGLDTMRGIDSITEEQHARKFDLETGGCRPLSHC
jgi:hypothetical protein